MKTITTQKGASMMNVLVAMAIFAVGAVAIVKFQGGLTKSGGESKERAAAVELVKRKIEDLKSYEQLNSEAGKIAYADIADDEGGSLMPGSITVGGTAYDLTWDVQDFNYQGSNAAATTSDGNSAFPDFKKATVTASWTDRDGKPQTVVMETVVSAVDPAKGNLVAQATSPLTYSPSQLGSNGATGPSLGKDGGSGDKSGESKSSDTKTDDTKSDGTKAGDTKSDDTKTDDTKTDDTKTDDTKTDDTKSGDTKSGDSSSSDSKADDSDSSSSVSFTCPVTWSGIIKTNDAPGAVIEGYVTATASVGSQSYSCKVNSSAKSYSCTLPCSTRVTVTVATSQKGYKVDPTSFNEKTTDTKNGVMTNKDVSIK